MNCPATRRRRALILTTFLPAILSLFFLTDLELAQAQNGPPVNAPTFHYDRQRTGWNSSETWLTPTNVAGSGFGPLWNSPVFDSVTVSGTTYPAHMFATPLYIDSVQISAGTYAGSNFNVVYAATTNNFIYAVNAFPSAGSPSVPAGTILWKTSLGTPANLASLGSPNGLDGGVALGVLGTPIIDMNATPPTLYVAAQTATATDTNWRVFALDITSGNILPGWPLTITNAALAPINQNGPAAYQPTGAMSQRGALNLSLDGKLLYVSYGAYGDDGAGWMIIVDTTVPSLSSAWSGAPSQVSYANGGMWGSGGPAIDSSGIVYDVSGNSPDGSENSPEVWGESALSWNPGTPLVLRSTYTPWNYCLMDTNDTDIAGTPLVIDLDPSVTSTPHLIAFGSKQGNAYLLDRNNMKGNLTSRPPCASTPATDTSLYGSAGQSYYNGLPGPLNVFGPYTETCVQGNDARMRTTPAYFKRADGADIVYFSGATKALACSQTPVPPGLVRLRLVTTAGQPAYYSVDAVDSVLSLFSPGPPIVTSNGSSNAIVWVLDANVYRADSLVGSGVNHPVLYALDANTMQLLWKSSSSQLDVGGKYNHVVVARGSVFVGTDRIQAFGIPGAPVSLGVSGVSFNPPTVLGGNSSTGTVTLNGVAPTGGATVTLSTNNSAAVTIPASVIVPQGLGTATFPIVTNPVTAQTPVSISASLNSTTQSATLTVNPLLASLTLNPAILVGGSSSTGTVTLNAVAPSGGITVNLSSNNGNAQPPLSVNVAGGSATATFTVTTSVVASATNATISASYNGATLSAGLGINPTGVASFVRAAGNSAESVKYTVSITPTAGDFLGVFVFQY